MEDYLKEVLKAVKNDYADVASNGIVAGDITGFIDTGSYMLNALVSGSIYDGIPNSKIAIFGSPEGVGKSFILLSTIKTFLDNNPEGCVFLFESESAMTKNMMEERGLDTKRIIVFPVVTVEEFRHQMVVILDNYIKQKDKLPIFFGLDSLGMLSTNKEIGDIAEGKDTRDMTRSQLLKAAFRVITLKLGRVKIPLFVTNHTYQTMEMFSKTVQSGGSGGKYASSSMINMTKRKVRDGRELMGNIVTCTLDKGRLTKEGSKAEIYIDFQKGLSRYHGLVEAAVEAGLWEKASNGKIRILTNFPSMEEVKLDKKEWITSECYKRINKVKGLNVLLGTISKIWTINEKNKIIDNDGNKILISHIKKNPEKYFTDKEWDIILKNEDIISLFEENDIFSIEEYTKDIYEDPEKYFTKNVLDLIDEFVGKKYKYGSALDEEINDPEDEDGEEV